MDNHPGVKTQDFFTLWCKSYLKQVEAATLGGPVSVVTVQAHTSKDDSVRLTGAVVGSWWPARSHSGRV